MITDPRYPFPADAVRSTAVKFGAKTTPGEDVATFESAFRGGTKFAEQGHAASNAAHALADERGTAVASFIDMQLGSAAKDVKYGRLRVAYEMLAKAGFVTE